MEPLLNEGDRQSVVWIKIKKYLEERLNMTRIRNDNSCDSAKTEKLRGRIAELVHLSALDKPMPKIEEDFKD